MSFLQKLIDRPVLATVISLVIALLGGQAIYRLTVREFPKTTSTKITVTTPYIGADADLVEGFITVPLEQAIATADGIDYLSSTSSLGASTITAKLILGYDPNKAVAEILTKIQQVQNRLPDRAQDSVVTVTTGGDQAAMYIAITSEELTASEVTDYLQRAVCPQIETIAGVQRAQIIGAQTIAMRIWLDPKKMALLGITPSDVRRAIRSSNFLAAVGETKSSTVSIPLRVDTNLSSVEGFERLIVRQRDDAVVRLRDVADVELGSESYDTSVIFERQPAVFLGIRTTPGANLLETIAGVRDVLPDIRNKLPADLEAIVVYDSAEPVEDSIREVVVSLLQALGIVAVVIVIFLGSFRSAIVPAVTMPLAIVGAFFLMQMIGYTINLLTLLALILAIGIVVDDAIIVVENVTRHLEDGITPREAAKRTVRELTGSIVAMNLTIVAVFAPIGFMGGLTGKLFTEFAYTVAGATVISGVVALTLSPMMSAKLLKRNPSKNLLSRLIDRWLNALASGYEWCLRLAIRLKWGVLAAGLMVLASLYFLLTYAQRELAPAEDEGFLIVSAQADPNVSLDQLERWTAELNDRVGGHPAVEYFFSINGGAGGNAGGSGSAFAGLSLTRWQDRDQTRMALQEELQKSAAQVAGLQNVVFAPPPLPGSGGGAPVQFVISSIESPRKVFEASQQMVEAARASGKFANLTTDLKFDRGLNTFRIDRDRTASLGIDIETLGFDLSTMLSGGYVNFFSYDGRSYRVVPQVRRDDRLSAEQVLEYRVAAGNGNLVPLSSFVSIETDSQPRQLKRFNQLTAATLSGVPAEGVTLGEAIDYLQTKADEMLADEYITGWKGVSRQYTSESSSLQVAFALAVILVYLVLAAQYESFRDPVVMLVSIPMALSGALVFFALGVVTINIYTQIGLLALIGAIIRHGILLVEFANDLQEHEGLDREEGIVRAGRLRLRSILMTTFSTVVGLTPLLVASEGPGASSRFAIAFTLAVGLSIGTIFTLIMVPTLYVVLAKNRGGTT